uniref:Photosystem II reaction center Psb28 protein n=1 Tax=Schizocladia ischiensis TaxID=196139 RepID=A0A7S6ZPD4_9STRA|nr:PsbW [Schizocladia ischiensis]QOW07578.1 PsbW [Schizocladia ischiensis]
MCAFIQFIKGSNEIAIPRINLTRSLDDSTGTATFLFDNNLNLLSEEINRDEKEITGMYLIDDEGILITKDVITKFIQGGPMLIQAIYIIKSPVEWNRFMRFMERYVKKNGLIFK